MTDVQNPISSPSVGARRKGPKSLPRLPLSAFTPPNSGTSEKFPLPPSPSTVHPVAIIDGYVAIENGRLEGWSAEVGRLASRKIDGLVLALPAESPQSLIDQVANDQPSCKIVSVVVPVDLTQGPPAQIPRFSPSINVSLSVQFIKNSALLVEGVKWALENGYVVDLDVGAGVNENGEGWECLEELLTSVLGSGENAHRPTTGAIILSNILPPPHDLGISIVKLLNHPAYRSYQTGTASLSLFPSVFIKFVPPQWQAPTPPTPPASSEGTESESKEKKEWKRRIKMYLGPALEAFGYQRIIYGSSGHASGSHSADWYEIARESLAELGVDQEGVDAVFRSNAAAIYGA